MTYASLDISAYTAYSLAINMAYCERQNCSFVYLNDESANYCPMDVRWNKVKILAEGMKTWGRGMDYLLWLDADLIFLDMNFDIIGDIVSNTSIHHGGEIFMSAESAGSSTMINSGSILIKNSDFTAKFLKDWWGNENDRKFYSDQEQFDIVYHRMVAAADPKVQKIVILPPDAMNSDPPAMTNQKDSNKVLHLMGEHTLFRAAVFSSGFKEICRFLSTQSFDYDDRDNLNLNSLRPQLGITKDNLLRWTLDIYEPEVVERINHYEIAARTGGNGLKETDLFANAVHHYAHALENSFGPDHTENVKTAQNLRIKTFELLYMNLENRREANGIFKSTYKKLHPDWPELMKKVAVAGQHLISIGNENERLNAAQKVLSLLNELLVTTHIAQQGAVMIMVAHVYGQIGFIHIEANRIEDAHWQFLRAYEISLSLAEQSGEHILEEPMSMVANTYSMLGQFSEAAPLFVSLINIVEHSFGRSSERLIKYLINAGMCSMQSGDNMTALAYLERIQSILSVNGYATGGYYNHPHADAIMFLREKLVDIDIIDKIENTTTSNDGEL